MICCIPIYSINYNNSYYLLLNVAIFYYKNILHYDLSLTAILPVSLNKLSKVYFPVVKRIVTLLIKSYSIIFYYSVSKVIYLTV